MSRLKMLVAAVWCTGFFPGPVPAVAQDAATVTASGDYIVTVQPNQVRVRFRYFAEGKSATSALGKLAETRKELEARIGGLGVDGPVNVAFGDPREISESSSLARERLQIMVQGETRQKASELVRIGVILTMKWNLPDGDSVARLEYADQVRKQIEALHLPGDAEKNHLDADDDSVRIRVDIQPVYSFLRVISDDEFNDATKRAYQNAERRATALAEVAGCKLGSLRILSMTSSSVEAWATRAGASRRTFEMMMGNDDFLAEEQPPQPERELSDTSMGPLRMTVSVRATYELK